MGAAAGYIVGGYILNKHVMLPLTAKNSPTVAEYVKALRNINFLDSIKPDSFKSLLDKGDKLLITYIALPDKAKVALCIIPAIFTVAFVLGGAKLGSRIQEKLQK